MKLLPKRTLIAATLAASFVGLSATAIAQGTAQAPASPPVTQSATPQAPTPQEYLRVSAVFSLGLEIVLHPILLAIFFCKL